MNSNIKWIELSVKTLPEFVEPISELFKTYGVGNVLVELKGGYNPDEGEKASPKEWLTVKTYIAKDSQHGKKQAAIQAGLDLFRLVGEIQTLQSKELYETEWNEEYKKHIKPINIGKKLAIVPTWEKEYKLGSRIKIELDPGLAFGTGHHPTTKMCLELLETLIQPESTLLDLGCGSAILSIAAAKLGALRVEGIDIDKQSIKAARQNIINNHVEDIVDAYDGTLNDISLEKRYHLIVANISSKVIIDVLPKIGKHLDFMGKAVLSGFMLDRSKDIENHIKVAGLVVIECITSQDWVSFLVSRDASKN
tara:strand:+ start:2710 stop:3633 length:924 start_codon:yes stop_codon:yes gene_type:complete